VIILGLFCLSIVSIILISFLGVLVRFGVVVFRLGGF